VQALQQRHSLRPRKVRQNVHAEDAVEAPNITRPRQIHAVERDQAAQPRLRQQVRRICTSRFHGSARAAILVMLALRLRLVSILQLKLLLAIRRLVIGIRGRNRRRGNLRKIIANTRRRQPFQRRLRIDPAICRFDVLWQQVAAYDMNRYACTQAR